MGLPDQGKLTMDSYDPANVPGMTRNLRSIERAVNTLPIFRSQSIDIAHDDPVSITSEDPTAFGDPITFIKQLPWTRLEFDLRIQFYCDQAPARVTFGITVDDIPVPLGFRRISPQSQIQFHGTRRFAEGIRAGTYILQLTAAVEDDATMEFNLNDNCQVELTVTEVL